MKINYYKDCIDCNGTGSREIFQPFYNSKMKVECNTCHGKGIVKFDLDENTIKVEKVREVLSQWSREAILDIEGLDDIWNIINESTVFKEAEHDNQNELFERIYQFSRKENKDCFEKYVDERIKVLCVISEGLVSVSKEHISEHNFYEQVKRVINTLG